MNPKDSVGAKKAALRFVPAALVLEVAPVMQNGAAKYGPFNWREQPVSAVTYVEAALRHLYAWLEGQDEAEDSGLDHIAHAAASMGILLDAKANDTLLDDRVKGPAADILRRLDKSAVAVQPFVPEPTLEQATAPGFFGPGSPERRFLDAMAADPDHRSCPSCKHDIIVHDPSGCVLTECSACQHSRELFTRTFTPKLCVCHTPGVPLGVEHVMFVRGVDRAEAERVFHGMPESEWEGPGPISTKVDVDQRGEWPPDTRVGGYLTCCGAREHTLECPQYR